MRLLALLLWPAVLTGSVLAAQLLLPEPAAPATRYAWVSLKNQQRVDSYTRLGDSIYCGEVTCSPRPLRGIDVQSFEVCPGSSYARDKNHVYYPLEQMCDDYATCGVCYCSRYLLEAVAPASFAYLGNAYATDGSNIFFRGEKLGGADAATFRVIPGPRFFYFAVDKNKVYRHDQALPGIDPATFYYDSSDVRNDTVANVSVVADKHRKWLFIPPETLKRIPRK